MDHNIDDVLAETSAQPTEVGSIKTFARGLKAMLDQALHGETISPVGQSRVNRIFAHVDEHAEAVSNAVVVNTPSGPKPEPLAESDPDRLVGDNEWRTESADPSRSESAMT